MVGTRTYDIRYDRWCGWLLGVLGMGRRVSRVTVDDTNLHVTLGWGFRTTLPLASVTGASSYTGRVYGWGAHGWRGEWLVNGSSHGIVAISINPAASGYVVGVPVKLRRLLVSVIEPEQLIAQLVGGHRDLRAGGQPRADGDDHGE
jgi:hypothetical protein